MARPKRTTPAAEPVAQTHLAGLYCPDMAMGKTIVIGQQYGDPLLGSRPKPDRQHIVAITHEDAGYVVHRANGTHFIVPEAMAIPVWRLDAIELKLEQHDIRKLGRMIFERSIGKAFVKTEYSEFMSLSHRAKKHGQMQAAKDIAAIAGAKETQAADRERLSEVRDDEGNLPTKDTIDDAMSAGLDDDAETDGGGELGQQIKLARQVAEANT